MNIHASYDALRLVRGVAEANASRAVGAPGATEQEVHALGYLACLLATWTAPRVVWGYGFHATSHAQPFAAAIADALRTYRTMGAVVDRGAVLGLTDHGAHLLSDMQGLSLVGEREQCLNAACDAFRIMPAPLAIDAIALEPSVGRSVLTRPLLDEASLNVLQPFRDALVQTLDEGASPMTLMSLWLHYLVAAADEGAA